MSAAFFVLSALGATLRATFAGLVKFWIPIIAILKNIISRN